MSVRKKGKTGIYHCDFQFEGVRYQGSTRLRSKQDSNRYEDAEKTDLARRKVGLPGRSVKFDELADCYEEDEGDGRPSFITEKYHIRTHLRPHFGNVLLHAISSPLCELYKSKRRGAGAQLGTVNRELATLKSMLKFGFQHGMAPDGLGKNARLYRGVESKEKHAMTPEEWSKLLDVCNSLEFCARAAHLAALVTVGAYTGLRTSPTGELVRLRWNIKVDFENRASSSGVRAAR